MRAKLRRRKRRIEFISSWAIVAALILLVALMPTYLLRVGKSAKIECNVETLEVYMIQDEPIRLKITDSPDVIVEVSEVRMEEPIQINADDTYISDEIRTLCVLIGNETGYCSELLMSIVEAESSGRQYAENGPCKGLMQINTDWPEIAEYMAQHGYTDIYDYETNIRLGCFVLDQKREIYGDDIYAVLMAYNGSSGVSERVENEDYTDYAVKVVNRTWELERLHRK